MSCIIQCHSINGAERHLIKRGNEPRKPQTWKVSAWLILEGGTKHTHSCTVPGQTVQSLIPVMGALIDSLIDEHGNVVERAGWTASTHGRK